MADTKRFFTPNRIALALMLAFASLTLNLAGNGRISLWDRDEARFATAARQMLRSGNYVVPRFNTDPRYDKPALIYWLMDGAMKVTGENELGARMPASIAGAGTVVIIFFMALAMGCGEGAALLGAMIAMTAIMLLGVAKAATTDAVLTLTVVAMMALLWRQISRGFSWPAHIALYVVLAASLLLKGPPGLLVFGTAAIAESIWSKRQTRPSSYIIHLVIGIAVVLALTLPWIIPAWVQTHGEYFKTALGKHVVDRSMSAMESHGGHGIYYFLCLPLYVPIMVVALFPWTAPALLGLRHAWLRRNEPAARFLLCWLAPAFVVFSLVATKLPHYIAPLIPAVALMTALWWQARARGEEKPAAGAGWWRAGAVITGVIGSAAGIGLVAIAVYLKYKPLYAPAILAALIAGIGFPWGARNWWRGEAARAIAPWFAASSALCFVLFFWVLPSIEPLKPSKIMVNWVKQNAPAGTQLFAAEYTEPTLVFYWGGIVELLGNSESDTAMAHLSEPRPWALITTKKRWGKWLERQQGMNMVKAGIKYEHRCFIFQRGDWETMVVVGNW